MGPATFVIAILGCADGGTTCTPVATLSQHYDNAAQCEASLDGALMENTDFDFPTILAKCRSSVVKSSAPKADKPLPYGARRT